MLTQSYDRLIDWLIDWSIDWLICNDSNSQQQQKQLINNDLRQKRIYTLQYIGITKIKP